MNNVDTNIFPHGCEEDIIVVCVVTHSRIPFVGLSVYVLCREWDTNFLCICGPSLYGNKKLHSLAYASLNSHAIWLSCSLDHFDWNVPFVFVFNIFLQAGITRTKIARTVPGSWWFRHLGNVSYCLSREANWPNPARGKHNIPRAVLLRIILFHIRIPTRNSLWFGKFVFIALALGSTVTSQARKRRRCMTAEQGR